MSDKFRLVIEDDPAEAGESGDQNGLNNQAGNSQEYEQDDAPGERRTLTRAELADAVHHEVGFSRNESAEFVELILDKVSSELVDGNQVKISSFGTFQVREKSERIGRNPKTGEEAVITPRRVLVFKASQQLKDRVNDADIDPDSLLEETSGADL